MLLGDVAAAWSAVGASSSRLAKIQRLAELLRSAAPDEVATVVAWLSGELLQRQIGVGWAALRSLPEPAPDGRLTVGAVDAAFTEIGAAAGAGSQSRRAELITGLFGAATAGEQVFLRRLLGGELRQGALAGVMTDAVARAAGVTSADLRRAVMLRGDLPVVAVAALTGGAAALSAFGLQVGRPLYPMLAQSASSVSGALDRLGGRALLDTKLDGARVQIHRSGAEVAIFTRTLDDVTTRLPEVVAAVRAFPAHAFVLDAEAIALRSDGRPLPFQQTAARFGRSADIAAARQAQPLHAFAFDVLHHDGTDLLDEPVTARLDALDAVVPVESRVSRLVTDDPDAGRRFLDAALAAGHEGIMVKALAAPYEAGRRGAGWLKVKPVHTLDLVVLAVEWGSGRRTGTLSNIHLGARDPVNNTFVMLGKTFKGMTDAMLAWQTERFLALADGPTDGWVVRLRPEQVVEIAFDGVQ
ncbi:MAG TPA: ATP-dependent DNA ligase, partial [Solirubrobacteraceae bacterium]|nr:ATP-dependent DNA ligase [Solirubrobacteraceae bacterium]